MKKLLILSALVASGCASIQPAQFVGPGGNTAYAMNCSGMGRTLEACFQMAGEVCPEGYTVVNQSTGTAAVPVNGGIVAAPRHSLAVECKG